MTLTHLRRVVLAADALALVAAGAAAWLSLRSAPLQARDWQKIFPVRTAAPADLAATGPGAKDVYTAAVSFPQGPRPEPVATGPAPEAPKVDDFASKYRLNAIWFGSSLDSSHAQLKLIQGGAETTFTVGLGQQIPAELGTRSDNPPLTPWRLNELREASWDPGAKQFSPAAAVFIHNETGEKKTLEMQAGNPSAWPPPTVEIAGGGSIGTTVPAGPRKDLPFRGRRLPSASPDAVEWEMSEEEAEYLSVWSSDQAARVSIVEAKDADGKPDGFILKGVPVDSRAYDVGFRQEDRVVSVNNEKVSSTADAMARGRKQFEAGTTVFQLKVLRKGKEMSFTFHAPKKKAPRR